MYTTSREAQIQQSRSEEFFHCEIPWMLGLTNTSIQFMPSMFNETDISGGFQS